MRVAIDSRQVRPGMTFFALKGEKVDGHSFLEEAAKRGAVKAIVEEGYQGPDFGMELASVSDVEEELQRQAKEFRKKIQAKVVGVTGSVGKTTAKEFIATLLESSFRVDKSVGSFNSQLTLPLSILNADLDAEVLVLEMGMSKPGELAKLTEIAQPEIAVITKIAYSHSENFADLNGIAQAKAEILQSPRLKKTFVGKQAKSFSPFSSGEVPEESSIVLPFEAYHLQENFILAKAVAEYLGVPFLEICKQAKKLSPFSHRFERITLGGITFIDDSYNANPASMKAALQNLPEGKRRIAVLGEMRELGKFSQISHEQIGSIAAEEVDLLFTLGEEAKVLFDRFALSKKMACHFTDKEKLLQALRSEVCAGDVVLLKGSNSLQMWTLLDHFSSTMV
ncbi:MAG: Mur ligase family protein [Candidatus Algichlamydia australiensis]|nr:Mur ligase family protein [Chlamydiales bacterium]